MFSSKSIRFNYGNTKEKEYGIICKRHSKKYAQDLYSRTEDFDGEAVIDDIIFHLTEYYKDKDQISKFRKLFTDKTHVSIVLQILNEGIKTFYSSGTIDPAIYQKFDKLLVN